MLPQPLIAVVHTYWPYDWIRHFGEDIHGKSFEYWSARDAMEPMGYKFWQNMEEFIQKSVASCQNSGQTPADHFTDVSKMIALGKGAQRQIADVRPMTILSAPIIWSLSVKEPSDRSAITA
jgi:hypothetical protein